MTGLEEGQFYIFRVRAVNSVGVGKPSQVSEPVCARALPGNHSIYLLPHQQFYSANAKANIPIMESIVTRGCYGVAEASGHVFYVMV